MVNRKFQIGSKARCRKSIDKGISAKLSLAGFLAGTRNMFRCLKKANLINLLKGAKLVMEIVEKIRSLISCKLPPFFTYSGVDNKS
jgi:hypothetical protein